MTPITQLLTKKNRGSLVAALAVGACALVPGAASATATAGPTATADQLRRDAAGCAYGANRIDEVPSARLEEATVCLINFQRAERGLEALRAQSPLALAARRHSRDMVARSYFAHVSTTGSQHTDRAKRAGYLRGARAWGLGEVLGWSASPPATPHGIVLAWMRSARHKQVLLTPGHRDIGVGIQAGAPLRRIAAAQAGTFTAVLGWRD